jgi:hypothetical protein
MIAAGVAIAHSLLNDRPRTFECKEKIMMVELKAVLNGVVVDLGG